MKVIDGAMGEGGGQIFRSSLTLAMCLGIEVRIVNIRAGRSKPGLLRQHLTCLRAAQEICDAELSGAKLGSSQVIFKPGKIKAGNYRFSVGSAGSTTLVFQTVYLPLLLAGAESRVRFEGGTHNGMAPTFEYIEKCFLRVMKGLGHDIEVVLNRYGFFPAGGGAWDVNIKPCHQAKTLKLMERGLIVNRHALALSSNIPEHVNDRELRKLKSLSGWTDMNVESQLVASHGPGNVLSVSVETEYVTEVFDQQGEVGVRAEKVAQKAYKQLREYLEAEVPVGEYLADQLLLPLLLGKGGEFKTLKPSMHLLTNIDVVKQLTGCKIKLEQLDKKSWKVSVPALADGP